MLKLSQSKQVVTPSLTTQVSQSGKMELQAENNTMVLFRRFKVSKKPAKSKGNIMVVFRPFKESIKPAKSKGNDCTALL